MTDCLPVPVGIISVQWVETENLIRPVHGGFFLLITYLFARMGFPSLEMLETQLDKLQGNRINGGTGFALSRALDQMTPGGVFPPKLF